MRYGICWLRYGNRRTGLEVRFGATLIVGLRWTRRVWNAPAGPYLLVPRRGIQLDAETLSPKLWRGRS